MDNSTLIWLAIIGGLVFWYVWDKYIKNPIRNNEKTEEIEVKSEEQIQYEREQERKKKAEMLARVHLNNSAQAPLVIKEEKPKERGPSLKSSTSSLKSSDSSQLSQSSLKSFSEKEIKPNSSFQSNVKNQNNKNETVKKTQPIKKILKPEEIISNNILKLFMCTLTEEPSNYFQLDKSNFRSLIVSENDIDQILFERLDAFEFQKEKFPYIVDTYLRILDFEKKEKKEENEKIIETSFRSLLTQTILILQETPLDLYEYLKSTHLPIPSQLLSALDQFPEEDIYPIIFPVFQNAYTKMQTLTLLDNFSSPFRVLEILTQYPIFTQILVSSSNFFPGFQANGKSIQRLTFFGPFFQISPISSQKVLDFHFPNSFENLSKISNGRKALFDYIFQVIQKNQNRSKEFYNQFEVSDDGFLANFTLVFLKACSPFVSTGNMKQIDENYMILNSQINFENEACILFSEDEMKNFRSKLKSPDSFSFPTEIFFTTLSSLHISVITITKKFEQISRQLSKLISRRNEIKQNLLSVGANIETHPLGQQLKQFETKIDYLFKYQLSIETQIFDPFFVENILNFYAFTGEFLMSLINSEKGKLPLEENENTSKAYGYLPEFIIKDIAEFIIFISQVKPDTLVISAIEKLITFFIAFINSSTLIKNPYLRALLGDALCHIFPSQESKHLKQYSSLFQNHKIALEFLVPSLFQTYFDIERTGRHNQFYEKFSTRRSIAILLKNLRTIPAYQEAIKNQFFKKPSLFISVVNFMINDANYLLEEVLIKLPEISKIESLISSPEWNNLNQEEKEEKRSKLDEDISLTKMYMDLANQTILLFHFLTQTTVEPFLHNDIIGKTARMLNFFLNKLTGSKSSTLKVNEPERFHFEPRMLLSKLIEIYLSFKKENAFLTVLGEDMRSYDDKIFTKASNIIRKFKLLPPKTIDEFENLIKRTKETTNEILDEEQILGEIPDEYCDELLGSLMKDPVILPGSKKVIDRSTISRCLLDDPRDPFNRDPLKIEDVISNEKLKKEIEDWKKKTLENAKLLKNKNE